MVREKEYYVYAVTLPRRRSFAEYVDLLLQNTVDKEKHDNKATVNNIKKQKVLCLWRDARVD